MSHQDASIKHLPLYQDAIFLLDPSSPASKPPFLETGGGKILVVAN